MPEYIVTKVYREWRTVTYLVQAENKAQAIIETQYIDPESDKIDDSDLMVTEVVCAEGE